MSEPMTTVTCPACGKELQIPAALDSFSCMYCGQRIHRDAQPAAEVLSSQARSALFDAVCQKLSSCVTEYRGYQKRITRNEFFDAFETYENGCGPVVHDLAKALNPSDSSYAAQLQTAADSMLNQLETTWKAKLQSEDDKIVIAIFFVPLLQKLEPAVGGDFAKTLQKTWVERHPKSPFYVGNYEEISGGFRKKFFGLCFITTAVCQELGKPDDCEELTAFRRFRDEYLRSRPEGEALIAEYYNIAPGIVCCINACSDRHESYKAIREQYLQPCYADILAGRYAECEARYVEMVRSLQRRYLN